MQKKSSFSSVHYLQCREEHIPTLGTLLNYDFNYGELTLGAAYT